jgi:glutathione peroxidase
MATNKFAATSVFDFSATSLAGAPVDLEQYRGRVLLIVNTASKCGFTPQYKGLEALHRQFKDQGLVVLGFPCNQFGAQEPASDGQIATFCEKNFGVTFALFAKVDVNGSQAAPLFSMLQKKAPGLLGSEAIKWNFTKFLVSRDGKSITRHAPTTTPGSMIADIERLLAKLAPLAP